MINEMKEIIKEMKRGVNMIIVLFDENEKLADFYTLRKIKIFKKKDSHFKLIKELDDVNSVTSDMLSFRKYLENLVKEFGNSKIIVGSQITGVPFHFFVKQGYEICEAEEFSNELLDQIQEDYIEQKNNQKSTTNQEVEKLEIANTPVTPVAIDENGNYFLDFIRIQKYRPEISSKKAILPFLSTDFKTLTIQCSHVMPWLENYFNQNKTLKYSYKRENGIYTILISQN